MGYKPIYLTTNKREQAELGKSLEILSDYLPRDDDVQVYVRHLRDIIEIRPFEGSLDSITIMKTSQSGVEPNSMGVSCNGEMLEISLNDYRFRVYFNAEEKPLLA